MDTPTDKIDKIESTLLECRHEFKKCIDATLDAYNDKYISQEAMNILVQSSQDQLKEIERNLEEVNEIRRSLSSL